MFNTDEVRKVTDLFSSVIIKRRTLLNQIAINFLWIIVVQEKLSGETVRSREISITSQNKLKQE